MAYTAVISRGRHQFVCPVRREPQLPVDVFDPRDDSRERGMDGIRNREDQWLTLGRGPDAEQDDPVSGRNHECAQDVRGSQR